MGWYFCCKCFIKTFKMTIYREGKIHYQEFKCGIPQGVLEIIGESPRKTGTTIEFFSR